MRNTFINKLYDLAKKDKRVILLTGDLGYNVLAPFYNKLSKQFINCGIAEENMTDIAAGLALTKMKPYTYSINNFNSLRCIEQIRNDICYHDLNVKIVSVGAGFSYGDLGVTHHGSDDLGIMKAIPKLEIYVPADKDEALKICEYTYSKRKAAYIRLEKNTDLELKKEKKNPIYKLQVVNTGKDIAILSYGSIVFEAIKAKTELNKKNIDIGIYTCPRIKPIDRNGIQSLLNNYKYIYSLEEGNYNSGLYAEICKIKNESNSLTKIIPLGLNDTFAKHIGNQEYIRKKEKIDANSIINEIISIQRRLKK